MNFKEALREIEGDYFDTMANLASGFRLFFKIAREQEPLQVLWTELSSPENQTALQGRVKELAAKELDPQYANQHDIALMMYLWLLTLKAPELAQEAAELISKVPNCFWAEEGARFFLQHQRPFAGAPDAP
jgi:hypothetical protein